MRFMISSTEFWGLQNPAVKVQHALSAENQQADKPRPILGRRVPSFSHVVNKCDRQVNLSGRQMSVDNEMGPESVTLLLPS